MEESKGLQFKCYNCGIVNNYPAVKDTKIEEEETVVKKCTNCATNNSILLPKGYTSEKIGILRGME